MQAIKFIGYALISVAIIGFLYIGVVLGDYYFFGNSFRSVDYIAPFLLQICGIPSLLLVIIGFFLIRKKSAI